MVFFRTRPRDCRPRPLARLGVESLETRNLLAASTWPGLLHPLPAVEPNDTLDQAQDLGTLTGTGRAEVTGAIGTGAAGAAEVDWYRFTLDQPAQVTLATLDRQGGSSFVSVLSLFNSDLNDWGDLYDPLGHRLVQQDDGSSHGGDARLDQALAPGTYYVAVSGAGNRFFHPLLAGSGFPGSTSAYGLLITTTPFTLGPGPALLASNPAPNTTLDRSPLVLRLDFSAALDTTISPDVLAQAVQVTRAGDASPLQGSYNFSADGTELQLLPAAPLAPGIYQVAIAGNRDLHPAVLGAADGTALGQTPASPSGQDLFFTFQVAAVEGSVAGPADDTSAGAHQLGDVSGGGLVQVAGAIGDDPTLANPAADVDLYHFQISGPGRYALTAEVFAGRIGSWLNPGLSLFSPDPATGQLQLVTANDDTLNNIQATDGSAPLYTDPVLYAGLTAGDYYLAVSGTSNVPDRALGLLPGTNGIFNPNVSHSGLAGFTTGEYVLNLQAVPDAEPPQVVSVTVQTGDSPGPPTGLVVRFSKPVNLTQLAYQTFHQAPGSELEAVYIRGADGKDYHPRLVSYDAQTGEATFVMLDGLPNGPARLYLSSSGLLGLADLAGNPLVGNDPSGSFVLDFTVSGPARGVNGNPLQWSDQEPNNDRAHSQDLGVLFPHDLQAGVIVSRDFSHSGASTPSDSGDYYTIQVLQSREYILSLNGSGLPTGIQPTLTDSAGHVIETISQGNGGAVRVSLDPGTYIISVAGWTPAQAAQVIYQLRIALGGSPDNPIPLTVGPAPAIRLRLVSETPPTAAPAPSPLVLPQVSRGDPAPRAADDGFLVFGNFPSTVLLTRATDTVGVRGPEEKGMPAIPQLVLLPRPDALLGPEVIRLVSLNEIEEPSRDDPLLSLPELEDLVQQATAKLSESWKYAVDAFFQMQGLLGTSHAPPAENNFEPEDHLLEDGSATSATETAHSAAEPTRLDAPFADGKWAAVLVVAGGLSGVKSARPTQRQDGSKRLPLRRAPSGERGLALP